MIEQFEPNCIIELGVSAGGTTCFIMDTLQKLEYETKVYSVDLATKAHLNKEKVCGYSLELAKPYLKNIHNHNMLLGTTIAGVIEEIYDAEGSIDMVIMDTTHFLPGELLDFLVLFPYLSDNAVIVLDDMYFAYYGENSNGFATQLLRDLIVSDRLYLSTYYGDKMTGFRINKETEKYIRNAFSGLFIPWKYPLGEHEQYYTNVILKNYDTECVEIYKMSLKKNNEMLQNKASIRSVLDELCNELKGRNVYIYGAGQRGIALYEYLRHKTISIGGFITSDDRTYTLTSDESKVYKLSEVPLDKNSVIVIAAAAVEIRDNLKSHNIEYIDPPNYIFPVLKDFHEYIA